ncbi:hypothetical protein DYBT9275_04451 [Dyadobacter sp. CECT 9275]|uniref:Uncharacterized protein n=1 Tax=Dyadobacter helix TaxID=2822344 RepID=A0A916JI39_9BACT|nr:hypothetical protein DYBT9275_04451 [Dyadobacter sp. CECT 9275]
MLWEKEVVVTQKRSDRVSKGIFINGKISGCSGINHCLAGMRVLGLSVQFSSTTTGYLSDTMLKAAESVL